MRDRLLSAVVCFPVVLAAGSPRIDDSRAAVEAKLQAVLDEAVEACDTRGVSAAVVFPDDREWTGASGVSHGAVPMEPDLLFGIGSVTKSFVAALTLQLVEEGLLSLEDAVSDHLPPYPHVDGGITIRQLLDHTSGLYMFWDNAELWDALKADKTRAWAPEEVLAYIDEPYFEPGEGWHYSNTNYLLLGMILEKVTGSTLAEQFRGRFWNRLGITGYLSVQEEVPNRLAHVFGDDLHYGAADRDLTYEPRTSHESIIFGSGGLFMTAGDLARWSQALFGGRVLSEGSMREMQRFVPLRPVANMRAYGLGVQRYERRFSSGAEAIGHGGGNIGSATYMVYLQEHRVSLVVMVNAFPTRCADVFGRGLIREVLRDRGALRWSSYLLEVRVAYVVLGLAVLTALGMAWLSKRLGRKFPTPGDEDSGAGRG